MLQRHLPNGRTVTARQNGGIRKHCGCPRSAWTKTERCKHPWHANVSHAGREYRVSLHKWAKKPAGYVMLQSEAKTLFRQWQDAIEHPAPIAPPTPVCQTCDAIAKQYVTDYVEHPDRRLAAQKETTVQRQRAAIEKRDLARTNLAPTATPPSEAASVTH